MTSPILFIDKPEQLDDLCRRIRQAQWIAVDTEFVPENTYYPEFCLLQLATPEWVACVDPLALPDLGPVLLALYDPSIIKVFHSCYADLKIFYQLTGKLPTPVFDTQVAARYLGSNENAGYAHLVSGFLNVSLEKAHTRADWSRRPLSVEELEYAADDVIYLCELYQKMTSKLTELGRLDWLKGDFAALEDPEQYDSAPENAWRRIRGLKKLTDSQLSVLQAVTRWREATAQSENCPLPRLLRDELLFDFARLQPETGEEMLKIRGINQRVVKIFGRELGEVIKTARRTPPTPLAEGAASATPKDQKQEALLDILNALVRIRAEENLLTPATLATRRDLEGLLAGEADCMLLQGWRLELVGRDLQRLLRGEVLLRVVDGCLRFA